MKKMDIRKIYMVIADDPLINRHGCEVKFFIDDKDKAEAFKKEFLSIPRDFFSSYSVLEKGISVYPDDTWETIMERGYKILGSEYDRDQWKAWCLEQEYREVKK